MKGLAITSKGIEEIASLEIKELINADSKIEEGCVIFEFQDFRELCLLCYKCQSADRLLYLIGSFEFRNFFEGLNKFIEKSDFGEWLTEYKKFKVECVRVGKHDFKSVDVISEIAESIPKKSKKIKFGIKDYEIAFFTYIFDNKCYFGVDFAGFELNKRSYKIFLHPSSLRGTIAYALVRKSGFNKNEAMLDPFSKDGVVAIEAAFYASGFPVNYFNKEKFAFLKLDLGIDYEKLFSSIDKKIKKTRHDVYSFDHLPKHVDYSRKNAKIAGVDKFINFSRADIEWLDIKFNKDGVDRIVTSLPASKSPNLHKIYNEFFYQSEYILKKDGAIALIAKAADIIKSSAAKHNFVLKEEMDVWSGEQSLKILLFKKAAFKI